MKTTVQTEAAHAAAALEQAGFRPTDPVRLVVEPAGPRKTWREIIEDAEREAPLDGLSDLVVGHVRAFRESFSVDPARKTRVDGGS